MGGWFEGGVLSRLDESSRLKEMGGETLKSGRSVVDSLSSSLGVTPFRCISLSLSHSPSYQVKTYTGIYLIHQRRYACKTLQTFQCHNFREEKKKTTDRPTDRNRKKKEQNKIMSLLRDLHHHDCSIPLYANVKE